jgi:hypothetical protein
MKQVEKYNNHINNHEGEEYLDGYRVYQRYVYLAHGCSFTHNPVRAITKRCHPTLICDIL